MPPPQTNFAALGSPRSSGRFPFLDATASAADFRGAEPKARGVWDGLVVLGSGFWVLELGLGVPRFLVCVCFLCLCVLFVLGGMVSAPLSRRYAKIL